MRAESAADGQTLVSFEHRDFEVHGPAGRTLHDSLAASDAWVEVLAEYERAAAATA